MCLEQIKLPMMWPKKNNMQKNKLTLQFFAASAFFLEGGFERQVSGYSRLLINPSKLDARISPPMITWL